MNTILNNLEGLDIVIHNLKKVDSKMTAGRFFDARRELMRVVTALEQNKRDLVDYIDNKLEGKTDEK